MVRVEREWAFEAVSMYLPTGDATRRLRKVRNDPMRSFVNVQHFVRFVPIAEVARMIGNASRTIAADVQVQAAGTRSIPPKRSVDQRNGRRHRAMSGQLDIL